MTAIKRYKVLFDGSAAVTGDWIRLDVRYDDNCERALNIAVTTGDTIHVEGIVADERGPDKTFLDNLTSADISLLNSYTADAADNLYGPWTYIRVRKEGTTGSAKVTGFV